MPDPSEIRPSVVREAVERYRVAKTGMALCISERAVALADLNREYGLLESDGPFSSGKPAVANEEYRRRWNATHERYISKWHAYRIEHDQWDADMLNTFEFLLLYSEGDEILDEIYRAACTGTISVDLYLKARAKAELQLWKSRKLNVTERLLSDKNEFHSVASQCRESFSSSRSNPASELAISDFQHRYFKALEAELSVNQQDYSESTATVREKRGENSRWMLTFGIWGVGAFVIIAVYNFFEERDSGLGNAAQFILYVIGCFYILALMPIRIWVSKALGDKDT